jgi:hypothetical protein
VQVLKPTTGLSSKKNPTTGPYPTTRKVQLKKPNWSICKRPSNLVRQMESIKQTSNTNMRRHGPPYKGIDWAALVLHMIMANKMVALSSHHHRIIMGQHDCICMPCSMCTTRPWGFLAIPFPTHRAAASSIFILHHLMATGRTKWGRLSMDMQIIMNAIMFYLAIN